jgi:hypothetical protein
MRLPWETGSVAPIGSPHLVAQLVGKAFPRIETGERTLVPVFYVPTPSPVTIKGMATKMLEKLGDPAFKFNRGRADFLDTRLINNIIASKVELVILDDFHHLIDKETNRILATVSDWLKALEGISKLDRVG